MVYAHYIVRNPESDTENPVRLWWAGFSLRTFRVKETIVAIEDLISKFEAFTSPDAGATPDIDAVLNGVTEVYNQDISIRDTAVQNYKTKAEEKDAEIAKLKQANYDLLMKQPAATVTTDNGNQADPDELDEAERAATIKVADLFTKRK